MKATFIAMLSVFLALPAIAANISARPNSLNPATETRISFTTNHAVDTISDPIRSCFGMEVVFEQGTAGTITAYAVSPGDDTVAEVEAATQSWSFSTSTKRSIDPNTTQIRFVVDTQETSGESIAVVRCSNVASSGSSLQLLEDITACSNNFNDPSGCIGATFVSTQAEWETCGSGSGSPVCVLTRTITTTASNRGQATLSGVLVTKSDDASPAMICAPGAEVRVYGVAGQDMHAFAFLKQTVVASDADDVMSLMGCLVEEYDPTTGKPGSVNRDAVVDGSTPDVEGVVFKAITENADKYSTHQRFDLVRSTIRVYANGVSSFGFGPNPNSYVSTSIIESDIVAPSALVLKSTCNGCTDAMNYIKDSRLVCDQTVAAAATPQAFKMSNDSNVYVEGSYIEGCVINVSATDQNVLYPNTQVGDLHMYDNDFVNLPTAGNNQFILHSDLVAGTLGLYGRDNRIRNIIPAQTFLQVFGGIQGDIEFTALDCVDRNVFGQYFRFVADIDDPLGGVDEIPGSSFRMTISQPPGCPAPINTTGSKEMVYVDTDALVDTHNIGLLVKVGTSAHYHDGSGPTPVNYIDSTYAGMSSPDLSSFGLSVVSPGNVVGTSDSGFRVAMPLGRYCERTILVSSGALGTCSQIYTAPFITQMRMSPGR